MADQLIRATAARGGIRAVGAITTQLTEEAKQRHKLSYVSTVALGRTMTAGLLLASNMKRTGSRVTIRLQGDGPLGRVVADAGLDGTVRGFVDYPETELPPTQQGKFNVGAAVGHVGYVNVLRDEGLEYPYTSTVELVSGEVGEDLAHYLAYSEQTPSALVLGEALDTQGIKASGGLLIQVLPKVANDEALVEELESRVTSLAGFTPLLQAGKTLPEIFEQILGGMDLHIFPETQPLRFHCRCTYDRAIGALKLFGISELEDMIEKDNGAEAICDFCGDVYKASASQLEQLIGDLQTEAVSRD